MAEQLIDAAVRDLGVAVGASTTATLPLLGAQGYAGLWAHREQLAHDSGLTVAATERLLRRYGSGIHEIVHLLEQDASLRRCIPW